MIHNIHTDKMNKLNEKKKMDYMLSNVEFLHEYYNGNVSKNIDIERVNRYMYNTGNELKVITKDLRCCKKEMRIDEGICICLFCGKQESRLESYTTYVENTVPVYIRLNHFNKILSQLQGNESFPITHLEEIKFYIKKHKINKLDTMAVKTILKKIKLFTYYDHVQLVRKHLGLDVPLIDSALETKLVFLFKQVDEQYPRIAPTDRNNFFNYNFILEKFFTLLNKKQYIQYLQQLKGADKIKQSEILFKKLTLII